MLRHALCAGLAWTVLTGAAGAEHRDDWWLKVALGTNLVLHGADLSISSYALGRDPQAYREANPLLGWAEHRPVVFGATKMGLAVGSFWAKWQLHERHPRVAAWLAIGESLGLAAVIYHNSRAVHGP